MSATERFRIGKAGFSLDISEPHTMRDEAFVVKGRTYQIWDWERQFWEKQVGSTSSGDPIYKADIDTTFALYNKKFFQRERLYEAVRVAGRYTCRHLPWYKDIGMPGDEEERYRTDQKFSYYLAGSRPQITTKSLPDFAGEPYKLILKRLHDELRPQSYFEIGTDEGLSLELAECASIAVDPKFRFISTKPIVNKPLCALYQMSSDEFFAAVDPTIVLKRRIDLAFLDGLHLCEFFLRDFLNTEQFCCPNSVIVIHDCLPLDFAMADREWRYCVDRQSIPHRKYWWTGDVWRCALLLKRHRPDLRITALDSPPTGLVLITNLDPSSTLLRERYASLVEEMHAISLPDLTLSGLHTELNVEPTSSLNTREQIAARFGFDPRNAEDASARRAD